MTIEVLDAGGAERETEALAALLEDAVDDGASIGFLAPLAPGEARAYWRTVTAVQREGSRVLLVARDETGAIAGSVQLDLATRANAGHRAEVVRLMVHRRARRRGLGRALMQAVEAEARRRGRTTLVLDTRRGDPCETLYQGLGWHRAGLIPRYAQSSTGSLDASAFYYKLV